MLQLCLLLAWPLLAGSQEPEAVCGPEGCYAVYLQRRSFLEAWRNCRELGGNLATLKHPEEAAQVTELLQRTGGSGEPSRQLFWIGLQRQPRQCFPQRPLRGFTWTTGDQDTSYTNWARPAGEGSCAASRCVVLDNNDYQWLDGSCIVPVDGYICRFSFQGMCPGLTEEGASITYTTPFGPADSSLHYVPFGTVAAVACGGAVPAVSVLCMQKEDGTVAWSKGPPLCREHVYHHSWCEGDNGGCQQLCLDEGPGYSCECHAGYFLMPDGHSCATNKACLDQPCQFDCVPEDDGGYHCQCPLGYELSSDGHHCEDMDECADAPCEHQCENTEGSFLCRCHLGFSLSEDEPGHCTDTDECQIPGVCQQMCVNYVGGFECYCTEGYELELDSISCHPVAQVPLHATAQSHRGGDFLLHSGVNHGWSQEEDDDDDHPSTLPLESGSPPLAHSTSYQNSYPNPPTAISDPSPVTSSPHLRLASTQHNASNAPAPADPRSPQIPLDPTASPPFLLTSIAGSQDGKGDAAVEGVRALPPTPASPSPNPGEDQALRRQDDRWLLVALLVPICVFVVIMMALGIVYCTRCGAQAKTRSVTQCYHWVISSAGKGATPPAPRPCQPVTCRSSV